MKTLEDARQACSELVAEFGPDHVYTPPDGKFCKYVHEGDGELVPGCAVGHVLAKWGVPLEQIDSGEVAFRLMNSLDTEEILRSSIDAARYLDVFQSMQDKSQPWGECLEYANSTFAVIVDHPEES